MRNFDSIDHLVEFGLGVVVAKQMISTMNQAIAGMAIPGAVKSIPAPQKTYFEIVEDKQAGPFSLDELKRLIAEKRVNAQSLIWTQGMPAWKFANDVCEVNKLLMEFPPEIS